MDANQPSSPSVPDPAGSRNALSLLAELRTALAIPPQERPGDWETETGKLVGLLAVDFNNQGNDTVALQEAVLITHAALRGNKAAGKRALPVARWAQSKPARISEVFTDPDEAKSAAKYMSQIRADWVLPYVRAELGVAALAHLRSDLGGWALRNAKDAASLLKELITPEEPPAPLAGWLPDTLVSLLKAGIFVSKPCGESFMSAFHDTISLLLEETKPADPKDKNARRVISDVQALACEMADAASSINPPLLFHPAFPSILAKAKQASGAWPKAMQNCLAAISSRVVNQLGFLASTSPTARREELKDVVDSWQNVLPDFAEAIRARSAETPELKSLLDNSVGTPEPTTSAAYPVEQSITAMLPEWDDYLSRNLDDPVLSQLGHRMEELTRAVGVRRFGKPGEILDYQPLRHHLITAPASPPASVVVAKPGYLVARPDGSERILLKALVEAR